MNTIQLECFIAVAEHLNFSRASEALRITQPAVSHQIQSLEEELNVKLFKRTSKSVSLTQEGIQFLPDAQLILKTALSAKERLGQREHFIPFELGCHNRMEINLLPPILKTLVSDFPLLRPVIQLVPFPSLLRLIEEQKKSSLYFREFCSAPVACICSPGHPLAQYETLTVRQLTGNIIGCSPRQIADPIFSVQNTILTTLRPEQRYFAENMESALTLVKAQIGYTLYPDVAPARESDLRYIPVTDIPRMPFGVYYRYDDDHPVLRRFLRLCSDILQY